MSSIASHTLARWAVVAVAVIPLAVLGIQLTAWLSASQWVPVRATVLDAKVNDLSKFPRFRLEVRYAYVVDGVRYENNRISSAPISSLGRFKSAQLADEQLKAFPLGGVVTVYADPTSPTSSALAVETPGFFEFALAASASAIVAALGAKPRK